MKYRSGIGLENSCWLLNKYNLGSLSPTSHALSVIDQGQLCIVHLDHVQKTVSTSPIIEFFLVQYYNYIAFEPLKTKQ